MPLVLVLVVSTLLAGCVDAPSPNAVSSSPPSDDHEETTPGKNEPFVNPRHDDGREIAGDSALSNTPPNHAGAATSILPARPFVVALIGEFPLSTHSEFAIDERYRKGVVDNLGLEEGAIILPTDAWDQGVGGLPSRTLLHLSGSKVLGGFFDEGEVGRPIHDWTPVDHGTAVASRLVGESVGACPGCMVFIIGGELGWAWIVHQTWIDAVVVTSSHAYPWPDAIADYVEAVIESGKPVFLSGGNSPSSYATRLMDSKYASDALIVAMTDGQSITSGHAPNPDIATTGTGSVADASGHYHEGAGTSYAAPWAAGQWARFVMEAWEAGYLERTVSDGVVRNRLLWNPGGASWADDGFLDGGDVRDILASVARRTVQYGSAGSANGIVSQADASFGSGYGVLHDDEWAKLREYESGWPAPPEPGASHATYLETRRIAKESYHYVHGAICGATSLMYPQCPAWYLSNDDWFAP